MTARHNLITVANQVGWPEKHTYALAEFYINLESRKAKGHNTQALISYQATTRRQWHEAMKGRGKPFNLSIFNENLFRAIREQIRDQDQEELAKKVAILSQRGAIEEQVGRRDRGRVGRRDRGTGRERSSRSRSPRPKSPNRRFRRDGKETETIALSACPICLSRKKHPIRNCQEQLLWDGQTKARCHRADGKIVDQKGRTLCSNWNQSIGCKEKLSRHIHECSGCGESSHGAQECGLAEKA